eukprot:3108423-Pleurochrysis_carterae.AAC.1
MPTPAERGADRRRTAGRHAHADNAPARQRPPRRQEGPPRRRRYRRPPPSPPPGLRGRGRTTQGRRERGTSGRASRAPRPQ